VRAVFQVQIGNEVFAAPLFRIQAVGETAEGSDRHIWPFKRMNGGGSAIYLSICNMAPQCGFGCRDRSLNSGLTFELSGALATVFGS